MKWYLDVLKKYATFTGRARRQEFWMFMVFNLIFLIVAGALDSALGLTLMDGVPYGILYGIYCLFIVIPSLAVAVRRLHDIGKSGWMYFIQLVPLIGSIWLLVLLCTDSQAGENQYGSSPKEMKKSVE